MNDPMLLLWPAGPSMSGGIFGSGDGVGVEVAESLWALDLETVDSGAIGLRTRAMTAAIDNAEARAIHEPEDRNGGQLRLRWFSDNGDFRKRLNTVRRMLTRVYAIICKKHKRSLNILPPTDDVAADAVGEALVIFVYQHAEDGRVVASAGVGSAAS